MLDKHYERKRADPFYSSSAWHAVRGIRLQMDGYRCQDCIAEYRSGVIRLEQVKGADMVHHIIPLRQAPEKGLDLDNLVSLCNSHHDQRHPEKHHGGRPSAPAAPRRFRVIKV